MAFPTDNITPYDGVNIAASEAPFDSGHSDNVVYEDVLPTAIQYLPQHIDGLDAYVWPGWVYEFNPEDGTSVQTAHEAHIGGVPMTNTSPRPLLTLAGNTSYNYRHYKTDSKGKLKDLGGGIFVELLSYTTAQQSTQFELPDEGGAGGVDGDYYDLIFRTVDNGGQPSLVKHHGVPEGDWGPLLWHRGYQKIVNVGTGADSFKEYDRASDEKRFRSHLHENGIEIAEDGDVIDYNVILKNLSSGAGVWTEDWDGDRKIKLRSFVERKSGGFAGINITEHATEIEIEGTGVDSTITFEDCSTGSWTIEIVDGLIDPASTALGQTLQLGECNS